VASLLARLRAAANENPWLLDALLALAMLVGAAVSLSGDVSHRPGEQHADAVAYAIAAAGVAPYYFRRRLPLPALTAAAIPVAAMIDRGYTSGALGAGLFLLAYTVAAWRPRCETIAGAAVLAGLLSWVTIVHPGYLRTPGLIANVVLAVGAIVLGSWAQSRRAYICWIEERAELLERDRNQRTREAVLRERLRIAHDLHDLVAASMGVVAVQAGAGEHVIDTDPDAAKRALHAIAMTSRQTLAEMRRMVALLRADCPDGTATHCLEELSNMVKRVTDAGVDVTLHVEGQQRSLPPAVEDTAYHVVQESLSNIIRHAHASHADVTIDFCDRDLVIDVEDNGRGLSHGNAMRGYGLRGLAERVEGIGGDLTASDSGNGFVVSAHLPVEVGP